MYQAKFHVFNFLFLRTRQKFPNLRDYVAVCTCIIILTVICSFCFVYFFHFKGKTRNMLYTATDHKKDIKTRSLFASNTSCIITPIKAPPDPQTLQRWTEEHQNLSDELCVNQGRSLSDSSSLLEEPCLNNTYGFKLTPDNNQSIGCSHVSLY